MTDFFTDSGILFLNLNSIASRLSEFIVKTLRRPGYEISLCEI